MTPVYLDIDGTLLPFGPARGGPAAARFDPGHGRRLAALGCELVWATTWMDEANVTASPALGLPPLPVLRQLDPTPEDTWFGLHWKTRAVATHASGRPFAWLDDEITDADRSWIAGHHPAPALLLRPDPHHGLRPHDLDVLEAWTGAGGAGRMPG